jgi:hypothetical protein
MKDVLLRWKNSNLDQGYYYKTCIDANKRSVFLNHTRIRCNWSILKFATCAVQIRYNSTFRKAPIRGISALSRYFHIHTHSQIPCVRKSRYLTFARLQNLIQWQCDTVNLTPPCKYFITHAKTLHAKYFMQRMQTRRNKKKNEQSRRNCEIKQQFLWAVTFILVTETKIIFLWWRHNKK